MIRTHARKWISVTSVFLLLANILFPPGARAISPDDQRRLEKILSSSGSPTRSGADMPPDAPKVVSQADQGLLHSDQAIRPGDTLYFSVSPAEELSRDLVVDQNGKISIPLIGAVTAEGKTTDQLSEEITRVIAKYVAHPKVDIFLKQSISKQIGLSGQVTLPGSYPYRPNMRLLDLISGAGGFLPSADRKKVRILRRSGTDRRIIPVNAEEIMTSGDPNRDVLLEPGDLVEVTRGRGGVAIFGHVDTPGVYDYMYDMRMIDLISVCHGFREGANIHHMMVIRGESPNQTTTFINFDAVVRNKPKANIALLPGDIVFVPQRSLWSASSVAAAFTPITTIILAAATVLLAVKK
jgi:polysaccharide export outer membrane protein